MKRPHSTRSAHVPSLNRSRATREAHFNTVRRERFKAAERTKPDAGWKRNGVQDAFRRRTPGHRVDAVPTRRHRQLKHPNGARSHHRNAGRKPTGATNRPPYVDPIELGTERRDRLKSRPRFAKCRHVFAQATSKQRIHREVKEPGAGTSFDLRLADLPASIGARQITSQRANNRHPGQTDCRQQPVSATAPAACCSNLGDIACGRSGSHQRVSIRFGRSLVPDVKPNCTPANRAIPDGERRLSDAGLLFEIVIAMDIAIALAHRIRAVDVAVEQNLARSVLVCVGDFVCLNLGHVHTLPSIRLQKFSPRSPQIEKEEFSPKQLPLNGLRIDNVQRDQYELESAWIQERAFPIFR